MNRLKCIAINPRQFEEQFLSIPLGLATIISIVKNMDHEVELVDFDIERNNSLIERIKKVSDVPVSKFSFEDDCFLAGIFELMYDSFRGYQS